MNTRDLAAKLGKQPQTFHAAICRRGSYYGLRPEKLPDGSLLWPDDSVERLLEFARQFGVVDKAKNARDRRAAAQAANASSGG